MLEGPVSKFFFALRRYAFLALLLPLMAVHRIAIWFDTVLYKAEIAQQVQSPVLIIGLPRSGTTYLHRLLSTQESSLSSMQLWELIFAPALCEKRMLRQLYRVNVFLGNPTQILARFFGSLFGSLSEIHPTGLFEAEEDFLALLCYDLCFLRVLAFPFSPKSWILVAPDEMSVPQRDRFVERYCGILMRHQAFCGRRVLSKNPSLTPWATYLAQRFDNLNVIAIDRTPREVVPSQLSSLESGLSLFGHDHRDPELVSKFFEMLVRFHKSIRSMNLGSLIRVEYQQLVTEPKLVALQLLAAIRVDSSCDDENRLDVLIQSTRNYQSTHSYSLEEFGISDVVISKAFGLEGVDSPGLQVAEHTAFSTAD